MKTRFNPMTFKYFCINLTAVFFVPLCLSAFAAAPTPQPEPAQDSLSTPNTSADESPMMLYLVPWNANPETNKNAKKITLFQPWGAHFDPLTPAQTAELSAP
jgi:hypothetical protein